MSLSTTALMTTTTTTTATTPVSIPLRGGSPAATLRSLYPRAAKAFLQRDFTLTHDLISAAFDVLNPPTYRPFDELDANRRKWDLLRITLETTLCASPPPADELESLPPALRSNLILSPHSLVAALHTRSLRLFTPTIPAQKPNPAFMPSQILLTLVLSSLKLECPDIGRGMVEEWLARRGQVDQTQTEGENGYERVLELYCLHVLPRLKEWDYAREFLRYENELPRERRENMMRSLQHQRTQAARKSLPLPVQLPVIPSRSPSPTPSASSSSTLSTTSTHTVVPATRLRPGKISHLRSSTMAGPASLNTAPLPSTAESIPRSQTPGTPRPLSLLSSPSRRPVSLSSSTGTRTAAEYLHLFKDFVQMHYAPVAGFLLFSLLPLVSLLFRVRQNRTSKAVGSVATADQVRKRLVAHPAREGLLKSLWTEVIRAIGDTVRMGGRGLV
ncbi:hypothetical protein NEOLEDRAFT_79180 [Neolentinus lepideus HHB14362 ss-1]|uniref:Uncharacterized protein n=1 Tax=Neolentinus lepideus HHB14362 ss-1 TaxID=1314782 RepID=A0A165N0P6_9AGAM|nr:hypothetical protein NEOLEDRAFT_79180 [Neolentinus lepideus HHB14362 ss-1]